MAKLFNFRCSDELMTAIEETANAQGISKSEAATALIRLGLQALGQDVEVPALERKTVNKTLSDERKTVESNELEAKFDAKLEKLREELLGELSA